VGTLAIVMAVFAFALFPAVSGAGTETEADRYLTALALVAVGVALRMMRPRAVAYLAALVVLAAAGFLARAPWVALFAAAGALYMGLTLARDAPPETEGAEAAPARAVRHPGVEAVRENVEAIATALVLALLVREFAFEAFKIPTASMEPTIYGNGRSRQGDRLLANKWWFRLTEPERWSIVVFKFPLYRPVNYIKRLVGLPGETVEIRDGDIYVDGRIEPKPDAVQSQLWMPLHPPPGSDEKPLVRGFRAWPEDAWTIHQGDALVTAGPGDPAWLEWDDRNAIPDLRIEAEVKLQKSGPTAAVFAKVEARGRVVLVELGRDGAWITAPGVERRALELARGVTEPPAGRFRFGLGVADRMARVYVDGRQVAKVAYRDVVGEEDEEPFAAIGARDADVRLRDVRLWHDLHYSDGRGGVTRWEIPEDSFVVLGDNTDSSRDSRLWEAYVITTPDGREFVADSSIKLEDGRSALNVRVDGETIRFRDSHGIEREFAVDSCEYRPDVRRPFVRREDLLGRAFFTFFPFPPFGEFRPRFLP
jgi:signal peptidase I